jgi:small subunit ribosomal protein S1
MSDEKKSFGSELEDELTPISVRKIFDVSQKKKAAKAASVSPGAKDEKKSFQKAGESGKAEITKDKASEEELNDMEMDNEFLKLIDEYMPKAEPVEIGDILKAPVLEVRSDYVLLDVGDKVEGMVKISELTDKDGNVTVKKGDIVPVMIQGRDGDTDQVVLSHRNALRQVAFDQIQEAVKDNKSVKGVVIRAVKGGLIVDVGMPCFMPASHIDRTRVQDIESWIGREVEAYVIDFDPKRRRAVLSRRQLVQEGIEKRKEELFNSIKVDEERTVRIKSLFDFGAFADLGPIDGFIPREEVSYERTAHPTMFLKEGQEIKVKVVKIDKEAGKVTLSRKMAMHDPWDDVENKYPVNSQIKGRVASLTNFGAFVQIEEGLTGMIHVSNLSWDTGQKRAEQFMKAGDSVTAVVLELDKKNRRMALGLKQITDDPWIEVEGKFTPGSKVKGTVTKIMDFGAFVKLDENVEALIHISNLTWDKKPAAPDTYIKEGQEIEGLILKTNREGRRISLGLKQLQKSPLQKFLSTHKKGHIFEGTVTRLVDFGAFVAIEEDIEGLLHVSEISSERIENPASVLKEGQKIKCMITNIANGGRKISLSHKIVVKQEEKKALAAYMKTDVKGGINVGDLLKNINVK